MSSAGTQLDRLANELQTEVWLPRIKRALLPLALLLAMGGVLLLVFDPILWGVFPYDLYRKVMPQGWPWLGTCAFLVAAILAGALILSWKSLVANFDSCMAILLSVSGAFTGLKLGKLESYHVSLILVGTLWIAKAIREHRPIFTSRFILALLLALSGCAMLSLVQGGMGTIMGMPALYGKFVLIFFLTNLIYSSRLLRNVILALVVVGVISAIIALISQAIYLTTGYAFTMDELEDFQFKETPFGPMLRATALFPTTNGLGHMLILVLCIAMVAPWRERVRWPVIVLVLGGIVSTFSNGAYILALLAFLLGVIVRRPARTIHYVTVMAATGLILYFTGVVAWVYDLVAETGGAAAADRLEYTRVALTTIKRFPMTGVGLNNFGRVLEIPVHNTFLQMGAEMGLITMGIFCVLVFTLLIQSMIVASRRPESAMRYYLKGLSLSLLLMVAQFFIEPLYTNITTWTFLGVAASAVTIYWSKTPAFFTREA